MKAHIGPLEYRAAEYFLREKIFDIGLQSIAALEGVLVHGPRGPSVVFLAMTTCAGLKQWKFPWDGEEFFVIAFKRAEAAARNLLMQGRA